MTPQGATPREHDSARWMDRASCKGKDPTGEIFYPVRGADVTQAKRICAGCPVREDCLEYAIRHQERFGVWGGTTEGRRRKMRRIRREELGLPYNYPLRSA